MLSKVLKAVFGTKSSRDLKKMRPLLKRINELEVEYQNLSEEELKAKTPEFQERLRKGETTDDIMCEAFAVAKNACRRLVGRTEVVCDHELTWDMIPYDVQIMGAIAMHRGNIAEMATGEGKTLTAALPLYLNALTGKNCQLVTVNDYLALRDSQWMGVLYKYLGLTCGCLQSQMDPEQRRIEYGCDITYGTNSEFGFDYLRDMGMATEKDQLVQRDHFYVIIDEIDSILIDEARTPLIISGPVAVSTHQFETLKPSVATLYQKQSLLCARLVKEAKEILENAGEEDDTDDAILKLLQVKFGMPKQKQLMRMLEDGALVRRLEKLERFVRSDQNRGMLQEVQSDLYFTIDERGYDASLTEKGRKELAPDDEDMFIMPDIATGLTDIDKDPNLDHKQKIEAKKQFQENFAYKSETLQNLSQLLRAYCLYEKDCQYVVQDGKVMIVDEHTGRLMAGRRFSDGLHQALEAKENVKIEKETQTLATITIQNYFRLYEKLSGMTGTAETEAAEFHETYNIDVIVVPTNKPCLRIDENDRVFKTKREKYNAIVEEVAEIHATGQPILLGTVSVDDSEIVSRLLKRRGIPHTVLNAKNHMREAEIVAQAGQKGAVTVATNMAGRGTDIKLGEGVVELGGLCVIGSARHDSRRIDRQLRGRCSRQGDPGRTRFYISLEDNLMRLFGSDKIVKMMDYLGMEDGEDLQHPWLNRSISTAQKRVEQQHFQTRKRTLEYDDVMNKQREVAYGFRKEVLMTDEPKKMLFEFIEQGVDEHVEIAFATEVKELNFDKEYLLNWLNTTFPIGFTEDEIMIDAVDGVPDRDKLFDYIVKKVKDAYAEKEALEDPESLKWLERHIILEAIDRLWQEHLHDMDHLRSTIGLRQYAQKDPLVEYKREAFKMFNTLLRSVNQEILTNLFRSATSLSVFEELLASLPQDFIHEELDPFEEPTMELDYSDLPEVQESTSQAFDDIQITFKRDVEKVGRNEPCPCGSGKKFKKCCGATQNS